MKNSIEEQIGSNFSYGTQLGKKTADLSQYCIEWYKKHLEEARKLATDFNIFLDTNVLLGYYQLPIAARVRLYDFLETNKERIYICNQVYREFTKHHHKVRRIYAQQLKLEQPTTYQKSVCQRIADFIEDNVDVLAAYPEFKNDLEQAYKNSAVVVKKLSSLAKERIRHCQTALDEQDLQALLEVLPRLEGLSKKEFFFLKEEFDGLREAVETVEQNNFSTKAAAYLYKHPNKVFPGIGDLHKKPNYPYGDYCIFHELMKWSKTHRPDLPIVFLTNDVTKSDWVDIHQRTYVHYLENFYLNTGKIFYILHAEAVFSSLLGQSYEHLVLPEDIWQDVEEFVLSKRVDFLTVEGLKTLLNDLYPNRTQVDEPDDFWTELIDDLVQKFEIYTILQLKIDLLEHYHLLIESELRRYQIYDQVDALEVTLELIYK